MTRPGDFRHDTVTMLKAGGDLQNVLHAMIGHVTRMNNGSEPVLSRGQGALFAALRTNNADLNTRVNALLQRLKEVQELASKGTGDLNYTDAEHARAAHQAMADPHTAAPLGAAPSGGSVGGVPINV